MCLDIPMKVKKIEGNTAFAEVGKTVYKANTDFLEEVTAGDYIIVHAGFAIEKMSESEAQETLNVWREIAEKEEEHREKKQ